MKELNNDFKIPLFDSKIKFYFSLLFISINDYVILTNYYGDNINIFDYEHHDDTYDKDALKLRFVFENIKWNNDKIELKDKVIMRMFSKEEIVSYYDKYSLVNSNFNVSDPVFQERFYIYMLLEKVREKKELEYGTIYELFDTFSDEEILNAVANLDFEDKRTFIELFGLKGDMPFEINSNDHVKNDILIKLYSYMLLKRDEADIATIIRNIKEKSAYEYSFYDYIRMLCSDMDLSDEFIFEMFVKMDYNSKERIKEVFGDKLNKKVKPPKDKEFKKVTETLSVVVKVNKEYRKRKESIKTDIKKVGPKVKTENKEKTKEQKKEPKEEVKEKKSNSEENKKKKEEVKKGENKKQKLNDFLLENNLDKKDFEKALSLLDGLSKSVIVLYYGVKNNPLNVEEISQKLGKPLDDILIILNKAEEKIVSLIKTRKINKSKKEDKQPKKEYDKKEKIKASDKLYNIIQTSMVASSTLEAAMLKLDNTERTILNAVLHAKENALKEVSLSLNIKEEQAKDIYESASLKIISFLESYKKEEKKEDKQPKKEEKPKEELKESNKKKENLGKASSLNEFLKETGLTKMEFFNSFSKLDGFSKSVLTMYLGLNGHFSSTFEIAKKYGRTTKDIERVISSSKDFIVKESNKVDKIKLNDFLNKSKMSMDDFKESLKNVSSLNKNLLMDYFGVGTKALEVDVLSRKYGKTPKEINAMVGAALNEISTKKSKKKDNDLSDKLTKFLTVNKITKEQFMSALEHITPEEKMMISMYFGLNGLQMSIPQIALKTKTNSIFIKESLEKALKQINSLAKNKDLGKNTREEKYQKVKRQILKASSILYQDPSFMIFVGTNPRFSNLLSIINMNLSIDDAAKFLNVSSDALINDLMSLEVMCEEFTKNASTKNSSGFQDEENLKRQRSI